MNLGFVRVHLRKLAAPAARYILAAVFLMAAWFKVIDFMGTATLIASVGFPLPELLTAVAALLELVIVFSLVTRRFLPSVALIGTVYVLFLGVVFHGPSQWTKTHQEFVIFIDHFVFVAALLLASSLEPEIRVHDVKQCA